MQKTNKFGFEINIMPNGLEKYMNFTLGKHLVFIDSLQLLNSSMDTLKEETLANKTFAK